MELELRGRPLHSRTLDVEATQRAEGAWELRAEIVDLRKAGFVAIAGDLQPAGLLHHMQITARVDPASARIEAIRAAQPRVAFEASALSRGESCRDPVGAIGALAGTALDADFGRRLQAAIGGPRGCSHLLALARFLGASLGASLRFQRERAGGALPPRRQGERIFFRTLALDGSELDAGQLGLALQLTEIQCAPSPGLARPVERLARLTELRAQAALAGPGLELASLRLAERQRGSDALERAEWSALPAAAPLVGASALAQLPPRVLAALAPRAAGDPAVDALLQLGPAALQCLSSRTERYPALAAQSPTRMVCGAAADSCYMWRRGGALDRARREEGVAPGSGEGPA